MRSSDGISIDQLFVLAWVTSYWPGTRSGQYKANLTSDWPADPGLRTKAQIITVVHYVPILNKMQLLTLYLDEEVRFC